VGSLERAALTLDRLLAAARWEAVRHASREAARAMEALRQAMTSGDQAAVDRALAELQRRMQELSRAMAALDAGQAREVANATAPGSADADLAQQVRELMEQGRVDEAMELLSRASSSMASMEAMQGSGMSPEELAALQAQLEGAVDQAAELVQRQERLNEGLEALNDQYPDAEEPAGTETLLQELEALRAQLAGIERWGMDPRMGQSARDRLERADRHLEDAGRGLSWADADRALRGISRSDQELLDLIELAGIYHQAEATGLSQEEFDAYAAELQAAEAAHMALIERLLAAERGWREARSEAAMAGLDQAQQQGALADDAGTFRDSLDQLGPQIGGAGTARRELGEAERWMRASAGDVELGLANRALEGGTEALQRLQTVERELRSAQEMMQAGGGASMPMASAASGWQYFDGRHGGAGMSSGTVDVPSAERFQTPEELRRAALEAALEDAPPEYRELNEAYYEELLR